MAKARFPVAGKGRGDPEAQFADDPLDIADEDLPNVLEDADKPKGGKSSTSKSVGKEGEPQTEGQAAEGAQAPPEEIPPAPTQVPTAPQPGTSTGPTQDPTDNPTQDPTQTTGKVEIKLTQYVKDYRAAGKVWLDTVVQEGEKAYDTLYDRLQELGAPHKEGLDQADKQQVYNCIKDRTGMFLSQDENVLYVEPEEEFEKPKFNLTGEAKETLRNYYNAAHELCVAQADFAKATQKLESKIEDKTVFLSIIQQVRLPSVQIHVRTVEEIEQAGRQDIQGTDHVTTLAKRQEDLLQRNRPNQDDGSFHVLCPVRTDHRPEGITDWMQQGLQVPRNPIQEASDRKETTWWSRKIQRTEKQEDVGRGSRTRR